MPGESRRSPITGTVVIFSPDRQKSLEQLQRQKPRDWSKVKPGIVSGQECPFCPGHEKDTPPEIMSYRERGTKADEPGWWARTVPNLFSVVDPMLDPTLLEESKSGPFEVMPTFGYHHLIVDMPEHNGSLDRTTPDQIREAVCMWRALIHRTDSDRNIKYCMVFKNHGPLAGASQVHSHSQLIALPMIPARIMVELRGSKQYFETNRACFYCQEIDWEERMEERIVATTEKFIAWCPFTSRTPYQIVIGPKSHQSYFANVSTHPLGSDPLTEFAMLLLEVLRRLGKTLNDPDYYLYLHTAPSNQPEIGHYHWHLHIEPVTEAIQASFERGSGFYINPRSPENAARDLRGAVS